MHRRPILVIAGVLCALPLLGELLLAQAPAAPAPRGQTPAAPAAPAPRGQAPGTPPAPRGQAAVIQRREPASKAPAPRSATGRVLLDGPDGKVGLWTPQFGVLDPILEFPKVPFQP